MLVLTVIFITVSVIIYRQIRNARIYNELLQSVTVPERGTKAEHDLIVELLKSGILPGAIFHDLYVKKSNGGFSQIDLVVATKTGIIVFEVKDYSGWIFGNGNHDNWTKVLAYGRQKYKFYNPIKQNTNHIIQLKKQLGENVPFYSVILFAGNCDLRDISFVPKGTFVVRPCRVLEVVNSIINNNEPANYSDKRKVIALLKEAVNNGNNTDVENQHIENIREMLGKDRVFK